MCWCRLHWFPDRRFKMRLELQVKQCCAIRRSRQQYYWLRVSLLEILNTGGKLSGTKIKLPRLSAWKIFCANSIQCKKHARKILNFGQHELFPCAVTLLRNRNITNAHVSLWRKSTKDINSNLETLYLNSVVHSGQTYFENCEQFRACELSENCEEARNSHSCRNFDKWKHTKGESMLTYLEQDVQYVNSDVTDWQLKSVVCI